MGGKERRGLITAFGEDQLGDAHIAQQEFENNVVYGVGYSHGKIGGVSNPLIIHFLHFPNTDRSQNNNG